MKIIKPKTSLRLWTFVAILSVLFGTTVYADTTSNEVVCANSDKAFAVYLYNPEKNTSLFAQNIDSAISPASTVKLMTALVAVNEINDLDTIVTISEDMISGIETNTLGLSVKEKIKVRDLLAALVCGGYNDAAQALAVISCGTVNEFVKKMNQTASELGANHTIYKEPTGVDDTAQTTARDTMLIAKEFMKNALLIEYSSLPSYDIPATNLSDSKRIHNRNALKSAYTGSKYLNSHALGMNSGVTYGGGYCVVTGIKNGDMTYICVVMGAKYDDSTSTIYSYKIANDLLLQIANLGYRQVISESDNVGTLPVEGSSLDKKEVSLKPKETKTAYLPNEYLTSGLLKYDYIMYRDNLIAPIKEGETVGRIVVSYDGNIVCVSDIVTSEEIERSSIVYAIYLIENFLLSRTLLFIIIFYVCIMVIKYISSQRRFKKRAKKAHRF